MSRRKLSENHIRNLTKVGGGTSMAITIPMVYIKKLGWKSRQKVEVRLSRGKIVIEDCRK